MKITPQSEQIVAQVAYELSCGHHNRSEAKALKVLLKHKRTQHFDIECLSQALANAIKVQARAGELREMELRNLGVPDVGFLTLEQANAGSGRLHAALQQEFPDLASTINFMIGVCWNLSYYK